MRGIQHQSLTNNELASLVEIEGVNNVPRDVLEHIALRYTEIFRGINHVKSLEGLAYERTPVPFVHA